MLLADDLGQFLRTQPVGKRMRSAFFKTGSFEQRGQVD
jgi:hypothetical protein